jgi:hypothetical protein
MRSAYVSRCGFVSIEFLPDDQNDDSQFLTERVLPNIKGKLVQCHLKLRGTAVRLCVDNTRAQRTKKSI